MPLSTRGRDKSGPYGLPSLRSAAGLCKNPTHTLLYAIGALCSPQFDIMGQQLQKG